MIEDVFKIIKADRYTKDGCDEIQKAKDNLAEDEKYNIGDISKKTGLMKTTNGWVEPKKARAGAEKQAAEKPINYESEVKGMSDTLLELNLERNNKMPPEMRKAIENELAYRKAEGERDIAMQKAYAEKSESKSDNEKSPGQTREDFMNKVKEINKRAREKEKMRQKIKSYINGSSENKPDAKKENPTRTFEFKSGPDGMPVEGSGKEVKTYKTKKEAEAALKKQNATKMSWSDAKVGLINQAGVPLSLNAITFGMTPAWAEKHGYSPKDVNGTAAEVKLAKQIITNQDWSDPEEAVKKINDMAFGYTNWKVTKKESDKVKIAAKDRLGNLRELTIKRQPTGDSAPRVLTGDCKIRIRK